MLREVLSERKLLKEIYPLWYWDHQAKVKNRAKQQY